MNAPSLADSPPSLPSSPGCAIAEAEEPLPAALPVARVRPARAYAPASIGNFAAGFDSLGAALEPLDGSLWGDQVSLRPLDLAESTAPNTAASRLTLSGPFAPSLPADPQQNLVLRSYALYAEALSAYGLAAPPLAFHLEKNLPVGSGLGSSASSVAATLAACQAAFGEPLRRDELYVVAGKAEALVSGSVHLDNVVPSLAGGLQLMIPGAGKRSDASADAEAGHDPRALPWFQEMVIAVVSPDYPLETALARRVLPQQLPMRDALAFAQNLAGLVYALEARDREVFRRCLRDLLAEPYRAPLVPGFRAAQKAALDCGALGCSLAGAGPAIFAVAPSAQEGERVALALVQALEEEGVRSTHRLCRLARAGARIL